jgi:hypothetical protein
MSDVSQIPIPAVPRGPMSSSAQVRHQWKAAALSALSEADVGDVENYLREMLFDFSLPSPVKGRDAHAARSSSAPLAVR